MMASLNGHNGHYIEDTILSKGIEKTILFESDSEGLIRSIDYGSHFAHVVFIAYNEEAAEQARKRVARLFYVRNVSVIGSYVNVTLSQEAIQHIQIIKPLVNKTVCVEHTSMTPCYPINLATARSLIIGEQVRRCAALLGATTTGRFWVEESARQLTAVKIPAIHNTLEKIGKADHVVGYYFVAGVGTTENAEQSFPNIEVPYYQYLRDMNMKDILEVTEAYTTTAEKAGVRSIVFDYEHNVIAKLRELGFMVDINRITAADTESETGNYLKRSLMYYVYLLCISDIAISIVPISQIKLLNEARRLSLQITGKPEQSLIVIYYGDLLIEGKKDAPKKGIFHTLDAVLESCEYLAFKEMILAIPPRQRIEMGTLKQSVRNRPIISNLEDNTIQAALMLDHLASLLLLCMESGRFIPITRWINEMRARLDYGILSNELRKDILRVLTLIG
jgi:hypothetical protein